MGADMQENDFAAQSSIDLKYPGATDQSTFSDILGGQNKNPEVSPMQSHQIQYQTQIAKNDQSCENVDDFFNMEP